MLPSRRRFLELIVASGAVAVAAPGRALGETPRAHRAHFGAADLFVPAHFVATGAAYDVVLHQHGVLAWQEGAFARARLNAVLVSVNLGEGSTNYERWFSDPRAMGAILGQIDRAMDKSGRIASTDHARCSRVALSGWSAGFGGVGALLAQPASVQRIDAVLLEDGLHTSYVGANVPDRAVLAKYAAFAQLAMRGDKLFAITHSAVRAPGYASTTETVGALLDMTGVAKVALASQGSAPLGASARALYEAHRGAFHVQGFSGGGVEEHRDHVRRMDATLLPLLEARWA